MRIYTLIPKGNPVFLGYMIFSLFSSSFSGGGDIQADVCTNVGTDGRKDRQEFNEEEKNHSRAFKFSVKLWSYKNFTETRWGKLR